MANSCAEHEFGIAGIKNALDIGKPIKPNQGGFIGTILGKLRGANQGEVPLGIASRTVQKLPTNKAVYFDYGLGAAFCFAPDLGFWLNKPLVGRENDVASAQEQIKAGAALIKGKFFIPDLMKFGPFGLQILKSGPALTAHITGGKRLR